MLAWRLCRRPHADLDGEGARRFGGRWNSPGQPVVYLAEHPALATLEVRVHLDLPLELLPVDYVLMHVDVPDSVNNQTGGHQAEVPADTVSVGNAWLGEAQTPVLRVPSILIPHSWNILLNPRHAEAGRARVIGVEPFRFNPRLWQPSASEG
ncbi:MAG TPA: RES family NAD+ phosphorylase [Rhodopila sp.]